MNFAGRNRGASWDRISLLQLALSQNLLRGTGFLGWYRKTLASTE